MGRWQDVFDIAVQYRRLAEPEQPVFWLDDMPESYKKDGYTMDISFVR